jgi:transposase
MGQIEESVARYLHQMDSADRQEPSLANTTKTTRLHEKIAKLKEEMQCLKSLEARSAGPADLAHRSRLPIDGDERPGLRRRRL